MTGTHSNPGYDLDIISEFIADRVDLYKFCFQLKAKAVKKEKYKELAKYRYENLDGDKDPRRSMSLVNLADKHDELGDIVYFLCLYWIKVGKESILVREKISRELEKYLTEVKSENDGTRAQEVRQLLKHIDPGWAEIVVADRDGNVGKALFKHGYAVLVGVGEYNSRKIPPIPAAANDVQLLREELVNSHRCRYPEQNVYPVTGPFATRDAIIRGLDWLSEKSRNDPDASIFFYFSGHGWKDRHSSSYRYHLLPADCDWEKIENTTISHELLTEKLAVIPSKKLVAVFDCCHAGGMTKDAGPAPRGEFKAPPQPVLDIIGSRGGSVFMSACREDQLSYVHSGHTRSIFTGCLIDALSGKAAPNGSQTVGVLDVFSYLDRAVPRAVEAERFRDPRTGGPAEQNPILDSRKTENFPVALTTGK